MTATMRQSHVRVPSRPGALSVAATFSAAASVACIDAHSYPAAALSGAQFSVRLSVRLV